MLPHFIQERQFSAELDAIEPHPLRQMSFLHHIECACIHRTIKLGVVGHSFVRVSWTRSYVTWYETDGMIIYLLSIKHDLWKSAV